MTGPPWRLPDGGRIDRAKPLRFTFDGRRYQGFAGDTLASALIANGVRLTARSLKLHRPRGILSAGAEEPNALVQIGAGADTEPNVRATLLPLHDGLIAHSQNRWPSLGFDLGAVAGLIAPLLPAGFYYKTFKWPSWSWYERFIRAAAGLGTAPRLPDPARYAHRNAHCDLLVVGAGPAGLAAALAAADTGARVILADQQAEFGGSLLWDAARIDEEPGDAWAETVVARLEARPEVTLLKRATVSGYYDHNLLTIVEQVASHPDAPAHLPRQRFWKVRAKHVVLATGAIERPMVFPDNDRPGIMLAASARQYINRHAAIPGRRIVVYTNNDDAYRTALDAANAGLSVAAVVDVRAHAGGPLPRRARARGIEVIAGALVTGVGGAGGVRAIRIARIDSGRGTARRLDCDLVAMSGGWNPTVHLFSQSGGKLRFEPTRACFVPDRAAQAVTPVGGANGAWSLAACLAEGWRAGVAAVVAAGFDAPAPADPPTCPQSDDEAPPQAFWHTPNARPSRQWVDFQHDVTLADIQLSARENFISVEHMKRYTTVGMSVDQGKTGNVTAIAALAAARGEPIPAVGTTTFRPPFHPVTLGAVAGPRRGELYAPGRHLPAHARHAAHGALFEEIGGWQRPSCYPGAGESTTEAVRREALAVRGAVGLFDASPLGKIEVRGGDAAVFLNRIYINNIKSLKTGHIRYGLMLNEAGVVIDDGVVARLAEAHYQITTTSGGAERIALWLEEWRQCEWPGLEVVLTPVTGQWATYTLAGPKARAVLARLAPDTDLSARALPHMAVRAGALMGVPARLMRVSLTGELSYEINVPAGHGPALWERLMEAGAPEGITPLGLDALDTLRTEKGYLHVGVDTNGATLPDDIGWGRVAAAKGGDFIGKRSLTLPEAQKPDRLQLVGLRATAATPLPLGGHVVADDRPDPPTASLGFVTSSRMSPTLGRPVALGLVAGGRSRLGQPVCIYAERRHHMARIVAPAAFDPKGDRLHG